MGEGLPFLLWRIDHALVAARQRARSRSASIFSQHFWITTSGNFSTPALICSMLEMGVDRILFSVDWPFVQNLPGTKWIAGAADLGRGQGEDPGGNAKRLLKL